MSRERRTYVVFGFESTHDALSAEALLEDMGIEIVTIPTPASIGTQCGIALHPLLQLGVVSDFDDDPARDQPGDLFAGCNGIALRMELNKGPDIILPHGIVVLTQSLDEIEGNQHVERH